MRRILLLLLLAGGLSGPSTLAATRAQCRAPLPPPSREPNIFTPAQESDLGDAVAERFESSLRIIEDDALTANLRRIGNRLVAHLPPTELKIQFRLVDIPDANAFVLPGGRIYVSRKLIGLTRTEDELASVLGHELGHLVARQLTTAMTKQFKEILNVTSLGDRQDVLAKYNRLMDNTGRKPAVFRGAGHDGPDQIEADRLGLFIVAAAGYDARAHAAFFDRFAETEGDTGGFFSRLFGTANPDSKRLGELLKTTAALPAGCTPEAAPPSGSYRQWQIAVAAASTTNQTETLPGLVRQTPLTPLRDQLQTVRFSPDGKYLLAQDDSSISVLDREPLAVRFRIATRNAGSADFTPDSSGVVFHRSDLRVERWSVADKALVDVNDLYWKSSCLETALAPDGKTVACVDDDGHLTLIDVATGRPIYQKNAFYRITLGDVFMRAAARGTGTRLSGSLVLQFSPSGQYLAAGYRGYLDSSVIVYDVAKKAVLPLRDQARRLLGGSFTFIAGDRLVGYNPQDLKKSGVIDLPSGQVKEVALPVGTLSRVSRERHVLIAPVEKFVMGLFDLEKQQVVAGFNTRTADVFGDMYASERGAGDVGLFAVEGNKLQRSVVLPAPLLSVRLGAVSPDLRWLTASGATRSAVWDTSKGQLLGWMSDYFGAFIDETGIVFADPATGNWRRSIMRFDVTARKFAPGAQLESDYAAQYGQWLLLARSLNDFEGAAFQMRDIRRSQQPAWTKEFERDAPDDYWFHGQSDALAFVWRADSPAGRIRITKDEVLKKTVDMGDLKGDFVIDLIDPPTGDLRKRLLIETGKGSFHLDGLMVRGDSMFVTDSLGRILTYTVATGELRGYAFGDEAVASADGKTLAVDSGIGRLVLYDAVAMTRRSELRFKQQVVFKTFSGDGTKLLAVTADQMMHLVEVK
jgi:hypothetical protein